MRHKTYSFSGTDEMTIKINPGHRGANAKQQASLIHQLLYDYLQPAIYNELVKRIQESEQMNE
jgi:hypothetical protein